MTTGQIGPRLFQTGLVGVHSQENKSYIVQRIAATIFIIN